MNPFRSPDSERLEDRIQQRGRSTDSEADEIKHWHFGFATLCVSSSFFVAGFLVMAASWQLGPKPQVPYLDIVQALAVWVLPALPLIGFRSWFWPTLSFKDLQAAYILGAIGANLLLPFYALWIPILFPDAVFWV